MKHWLVALSVLGIGLLALGPYAETQQFKAETGGIVIGRDAVSATINIGIPPEQVAALIKQSTDLSEAQKKLNTCDGTSGIATV